MPDFSLKFERAPFEALDQLALLARQDYNLGGAEKWFGEFRGGLYGLYARLYGVEIHYTEVHAWRPRVRLPSDADNHLTSIFFHMDSATECLTFALNALGWAVAPSDFRDVTDPKALRSISPTDVIGGVLNTRGSQLQPGFAKVFPRLQALWQGQASLLARIRDLHDVSKHRQTIFVGGKARSDPPEGFFEALGVAGDVNSRALLSPMAEIILKSDPKVPAIQRVPTDAAPHQLLEDLMPSFVSLMNGSGQMALEDATANVPLNERRFRTK